MCPKSHFNVSRQYLNLPLESFLFLAFPIEIYKTFVSFRDHVCKLKLKALRLIAMLFKSLSYKFPRLYLFAYLNYILPLVEYCSVFYSKNSATNTKVIEKIQKIFTRKLSIRLYRSTSNLIIPSYCDRLKLFHLPTLESRSTKADLLKLYKIIHNHISVPLFRIIFSSRHTQRISLRPARLSL